MRLAKTTSSIACLAVLALGFAGCGSSDDKGKQIPASTRQELEKRLTSVEKRFDNGGGACSDIADDQRLVQVQLDGLPRDVDPDVRNALRNGFDRLFELTATQCDEQKGQQTETTHTETTPAPVPTETTPTETTPTDTTPVEPKKPKKNGKNGAADGNGGGNSVPQAGGGTGGGTVSP